MHDERTSRRCTICGEVKSLEDFDVRRSDKRYGRQAQCKVCRKTYRAEPSRAERARETTRDWLAANPDADKTRYWRNVEASREKARRVNASRKAAGVPGPRASARRDGYAALYRAAGGICGICGELVPADSFTVDHIVPVARGGRHESGNLQIAHLSCNSRKGARLWP